MIPINLREMLAYCPTWIPAGYAHRAARAAVLGAFSKPRQGPDAIRRTVMAVLSTWRHRVKQLEKAGWKKRPLAACVLLNCCHSMVAMEADTVEEATRLACGYRRICPFCYAADVVRCYKQIDAWLANQPGKVADFVVLSWETVVGHANLSQDFSQAREWLHENIALISPVASFARISASPIRKKTEWRLRLRMLAAVLPETTRRSGCGELKISYHKDISRKPLIGLVGFVNRYPKGLLQSHESRVKHISEFLNLRFRAVSTTGAWRNRRGAVSSSAIKHNEASQAGANTNDSS